MWKYRCIHHGCTKVISQRNSHRFSSLDLFRSLGPLTYLRLWHDNSGGGNSASWFVKYVIIRDLQTMIKSHFLCQRWFAVEKDDGMVS